MGVCFCVNLYLSELPDDTWRFALPVTRAVPHSNVVLSLRYFSTQLSHRVETDLLLGCVFKVLEQRRDVVICCLYTARTHGSSTQNRKILGKKSNWKNKKNETKITLCLLTNCSILLHLNLFTLFKINK